MNAITTQHKKRIAAGLLACCAIWPGVHHGLSRIYEFDPWKFFGWSMYAVPNPTVDVTVGQVAGGKLDVIVLTGPLGQQARQFAERRSVLGKWLPPDRLADAVFAAHPEVDRMIVRVRRWIIDRETARFRPVHQDYGYQRQPGLRPR